MAKELVKQVYVAEKLAPPSLAQVSYTCASSVLSDRDPINATRLTRICVSPLPLDFADQSFYNDAKSPSFWQSLWKSGEWKRWAVYAVEAYGIFKIGEMVGRR